MRSVGFDREMAIDAPSGSVASTVSVDSWLGIGLAFDSKTRTWPDIACSESSGSVALVDSGFVVATRPGRPCWINSPRIAQHRAIASFASMTQCSTRIVFSRSGTLHEVQTEKTKD
jgi:hypothetical protein